MKRITILTTEGSIILIDDSDQLKEEIIKDLSDMMKATTIAIIHTSETSAVVRPSRVTGIIIHDDTDPPTQEASQIVQEETKITDKQLEQTIETSDNDEDIVTDME